MSRRLPALVVWFALSAAAAAQLNGLAFAWSVFKNWLRGLFSNKTA